MAKVRNGPECLTSPHALILGQCFLPTASNLIDQMQSTPRYFPDLVAVVVVSTHFRDRITTKSFGSSDMIRGFHTRGALSFGTI